MNLGKDGTRAFVSGKFNDEGLTDNIEGLSPQDALGLEDWVQFYTKTYKYIGIYNFYIAYHKCISFQPF